MNQYRYRIVNQVQVISFLPQDIAGIKDDESNTVHLGVGAMMPNDLSAHILGEIAQTVFSRF